MATSTSHAKRYQASTQAFAQAQAVMPGGVNSPVRAYQAVGREPITIQSGHGARVTDLDGNSYIDYVGAYGPLILGHSPHPVIEAITHAASLGTAFGMPTQAETRLAAMVVDAFDSIDLIRFVNSGTEAVMSTIRLARAATKRDKIVKCAGCYHGHSDALLVDAGSGATTHGTPSSPGVPHAATQDTVIVPFNDLGATVAAFAEHGDQIACVLVEPVAGNMGCIPPADGYLAGLRDLCDRHGALLVFDEVMTGFRVAYGGAQHLYGVSPDLTCLGKIVGGGLPCAAYGGREQLMRLVSPDGPVYQAGTLSGNPLAMAAGIATLDALKKPGVYDQLDRTAAALADAIRNAAGAAGIKTVTNRVGSMVSCFFSTKPVTNYNQALRCRMNLFASFFNHMLDRGVVLPPSQFETWFVSTAHDDQTVAETAGAAWQAFEAIKQTPPTNQ